MTLDDHGHMRADEHATPPPVSVEPIGTRCALSRIARERQDTGTSKLDRNTTREQLGKRQHYESAWLPSVAGAHRAGSTATGSTPTP
ncbi:MAG: hypothetical protein H7240_09020 [Glaciimonas sp.]|nr:hypothetical protein [Glaciimonas sp.]